MYRVISSTNGNVVQSIIALYENAEVMNNTLLHLISSVFVLCDTVTEMQKRSFTATEKSARDLWRD